MKRVFLNLFLLSLMGAAFCSTAQAANDSFNLVVNAPRSGWVVREIPAKGGAGVGYCSMRAAYASGHTLVFARDVNGSNTIAIDYGKPEVQAGQQYVVFITVGGAARQITAIAATESVLALRIGSDTALFDELAGNRMATFKVGAKDLVFNLYSGMARALDTLDQCVASISQEGQKFTAKQVDAGSDIKAVSTVKAKAPQKPGTKTAKKKVKAKAPVKVSRRQTRGNTIKVDRNPVSKRQDGSLMPTDDEVAEVNKSILDSIRQHRRTKAAPKGAAKRPYRRRLAGGDSFADRMRMSEDRDVRRMMEEEDFLGMRGSSDRFRRMSRRDRALTRGKIETNQERIRRLMDDNRNLSLENKMVHTKSKEWALESKRNQNEIREEILRLKRENLMLAMELEEDKGRLEAELSLLKKRNFVVEKESERKIQEARRLAMQAKLKQDQLEAETELMRERNRAVELQTRLEREEARRRSLQSQVEQRRIDQEVQRIRIQNEKLLNRIADIKDVYAETSFSATNSPIATGLDGAATGAYQLKAVLYNSGVVGDGYLDVDTDPTTKDTFYKWDNSGVYGFAREMATVEDEDMPDVAADYMKHLQEQCGGGDFAKTIGDVHYIGSAAVLEAEMACMGVQDEVAAAILFLNDGDKLTIISQEGLPDYMANILDRRDMIISELQNS